MRYRVTLTRKVTERTIVVVDAASAEDAEDKAYNEMTNGEAHCEWCVMDGDHAVIAHAERIMMKAA